MAVFETQSKDCENVYVNNHFGPATIRSAKGKLYKAVQDLNRVSELHLNNQNREREHLEQEHSEHEQPEHEQPEHEKPEQEHSEHEQPEHEQPEHEKPENDKPEHEQPEHEQPERKHKQHLQPEHEYPEHEQPEHEEPENDQPEYEQPEHEQPECKHPVHEQPKAFSKDITQHYSSGTFRGLAGKHECLQTEGGEDNLHHHFRLCEKNPGHTELIPVNKFSMQHLPEDHRDNDVYECIKAAANLTVRVDVRMTSPNRPEFWPGTDDPYPFYDIRGKNYKRYGSGRIYIYKYIDGCAYNVDGSRNDILDTKYRACPCEKCQHLQHSNNIWWEIFINTATHVVFDDFEATHTYCRLFYDDDTSPEVTLEKASIYYTNVEEDYCEMKYVTCDSALGQKLYEMETHLYDVWIKVVNKYASKADDRFSFIVSHPHGCTKQISLGRWVESYFVREDDEHFNKTKLSYTTCTCPGSSGARVYCMAVGRHIHCAAQQEEFNYSGIGFSKK